MPRYIDQAGKKFWEIERDGATIVRRAGKVGTAGRALSQTFANPLLARWHYATAVGRKTHTDKFQLAGAPPAPPTDPLPADADARLVHADALQTAGDPLGELIALQHAHGVAPDEPARAHVARGVTTRARLAAAIDELVNTHEARLFGDLACARSLFSFEWHLGRLRSATLGCEPGEAEDWRQRLEYVLPDVPRVYLLGTALGALFDLEIARSLEALTIGSAGTVDYQHTLIEIAAHAPPTLRRLAIEVGRTKLRAWLGSLRFPALEAFACSVDLTGPALDHVATAHWPMLRHLAFALPGSQDPLRVGPDEVATALAELAPLFAAAGVPALRHVEIWTPAPAPLVQAVLASRLVAQLDELVIRSRRMCDPVALAALAEGAPHARFEQMPIASMRSYGDG